MRLPRKLKKKRKKQVEKVINLFGKIYLHAAQQVQFFKIPSNAEGTEVKGGEQIRVLT